MITPDDVLFDAGEDCPSAEEISAFLDGSLAPQDRARLLEHFASCEDCYQVLRGAGNFLFQAAQPQGGAAVVPLARATEGRRNRWALPLLAAAAVLMISTAFLVYRSLTARPELRAAELFRAPASADGRELAGLAWRGERLRKGGAADVGVFETPFRLGVQTVNLQAALETGDRGLAEDALAQVNRLLEKTRYAADAMAPYQDLVDRLRSSPPQSLLEPAAQAEQALEKVLNPLFFDFGKWTAAGWLASLSQDSTYFERRETRSFARWLLRQKEETIDPEALAEVRTIQEILDRSPLTPADYEELQERFEAILQVYYPGPVPEGLAK